MKQIFDHEKLDVYQDSIRFVSWADRLLEDVPKTIAVYSQLERAATSIPLNIAEGNGKFTPADRCRFFDIARGSALECAACLDVLMAKKKIETCADGKQMLASIVAMLVGLIRSTSAKRVYESGTDYSVPGTSVAD